MADLVLRGHSKETLTVEIAGQSVSFPTDSIPTILMIRAARSLQRIGKVADGEEEATDEELERDLGHLWSLASVVLKDAEPPIDARQELTEEDMLKLAGFLAMKYHETRTSNDSSNSPTSSTEPSLSNGFSEIPATFTQPYELQNA